MNAVWSDRIGEALHTIIMEQIHQKELQAQLLDFVSHQSEKGFPFGELLILHYNMFGGGETEEIYTVAAAIELLILSFDILDDLEDGDVKKENETTIFNLELNATTALLFLSATVIGNTNCKNKENVMPILLKYALQSIHGQHKDLLNSCRDEKSYIAMAMEKSGSLVALSCLIGAALAVKHYPMEVETYAHYIGLIGQINNDLADITTWDNKNDVLNKKFSLPIIYLLNSKDTELEFLHDYYNNKLGKNQILQAQGLIAKKFSETGAIAYTEVMKKIYQNKAINEIEKLDVDPYYRDLLSKYIY